MRILRKTLSHDVKLLLCLPPPLLLLLLFFFFHRAFQYRLEKVNLTGGQLLRCFLFPRNKRCPGCIILVISSKIYSPRLLSVNVTNRSALDRLHSSRRGSSSCRIFARKPAVHRGCSGQASLRLTSSRVRRIFTAVGLVRGERTNCGKKMTRSAEKMYSWNAWAVSWIRDHVPHVVVDGLGLAVILAPTDWARPFALLMTGF